MPRPTVVPYTPTITPATVMFTCPHCKESQSLGFDLLDTSSNEQECETHGSHGERTVYAACPACRKDVLLYSSEW